MSAFGERISFFTPITNAAVHGNHIRVAHLLQVVGCQSRAKAAAAIKNHFCVQFGHLRFDVALDDASAQMNRARKMIFGELVVFADVDQQKLVAAIHSFLDRIDIGLAHPSFGVVHNLQKAGRMLMGHEILLQSRVESTSYQACLRGSGNSALGSMCAWWLKSRKIGLARALSKLGYCSRSEARLLIRAGRVRLNGVVRKDPETPVRLSRDRIVVDGAVIEEKEKIYLVMNKPRGLLTTASDEKGRETVYSILTNGGESLPWVAPVGRLDKASEGLLLLTNDSEWGARIAAPETHLEKTYHVHVGAIPDDELAKVMVRGVKIGDGDFLKREASAGAEIRGQKRVARDRAR